MKRTLLILALMSVVLGMQAQHRINSFFNELGTVRIETQELDENADTIATIFHRTDDVVWSRVIYRIIDMRFKQNYQLYFPTNPDDPKYWSLFRLIMDAVVNGRTTLDGQQEYLRLYGANPRGIKPLFLDSAVIARGKEMQTAFAVRPMSEIIDTDDRDEYLVTYDDSSNHRLDINTYGYSNYVKNQIKYLTMEIVFFDKHTSRFYQKIMAIAPLQSAMASERDPYDNLVSQVRFWILFDDLRPFMARKYMIPSNNSSKRMTFDNFFSEHLYTSYIIGDDNIFDRMIVQGQKELTEEFVHRDQDRIFNELLNTELDLWEY
jgi:gliding motility associated protien GldN